MKKSIVARLLECEIRSFGGFRLFHTGYYVLPLGFLRLRYADRNDYDRIYPLYEFAFTLWPWLGKRFDVPGFYAFYAVDDSRLIYVFTAWYREFSK